MIPFAALPWKFIGGGVAALALVAGVGLHLRGDRLVREERDGLRIDLADMTDKRDTEVENHRQTKENYRAAQEEAARLEAERIARVKREQERITANVVSDYKRRIADVRARSLRSQSNGTAADGSAIRIDLSDASDPASGIDGAPEDYRLPDNERLIATEQAIQLDELISWVQGQFQVEVNP